MSLDQRHGRVWLEIADDRQDRVVRPIKGLEEFAHVVERRSLEILHRAQHRVVVGMLVGVDELLQLLVPRPVRLVVDR